MTMDGTARKILIVEDDELTGTMLENTVRSSGFVTRRARDGREAIEAAQEWHPDLILLDLVMPGIGGVEVCEAVRSMDLPSRPSVVIVSSRDEKSVIADALAKGADDFIVKPVDELELLARIRAQLRIVEFYEEVERDNRDLETILEITTAIGGTLDASQILEVIVDKVADVIGATRCSIVLIADDEEGYVLVSHEDPNVRDLKIDLKKYPEIREVIRTRTPLALTDMVNHPLMHEVKGLIKELESTSILVVPIVFKERVLGTLFLRARRRDGGFSKREVEFCQIVANASCQALKNAKLYEKVVREKEHLRELSITDQLTTLYNHNFFYTRLEEEFERATRYRTDLSLILMDIDDFKRINDCYGHRKGDAVLKEISALIKRSVRKTDLAARYGGEEIAVILPQTPMSGAAEEAERIRRSVEAQGYAGLAGEKITVSIGVASYPHEKMRKPEDLVNSADRALYEAKSTGKNRVVVSPLHENT